MKNRVKVTIAALAVGLLTVCTGITGYAVEDQGATDKTNMIYTVTYNYNNGSDNVAVEFPKETGSLILGNSTPTKEGYELTGWWYVKDEYHNTEEKFDKDATITFANTFKDDPTPTLVAEWTQLVTVTVDETESGTVKAGNVYSVTPAASDKLKLDKWLLNGEKIEHGEDNKGTIKVEKTEAENHVINVSDKTGFGITSENPNATLDSYWSPKEGYLIKVKNEIGHPLNLDNKKIASGTTSDALGIMSVLPKESDAHFVIENNDVANYMKNATSEYIKYEGNNVLCNTITLKPNDVDRKIIVIYPASNEVKFSGQFNQILKNGGTLSVQSLLDNSTINGQKNEAKKEGFTKYRWTYSVKDIKGNSTEAESIPSDEWVGGSSENILERTFNYSFPYYEFEFTPVWQGDVKFELDIPTGESAKTPDAIEGVDVGTEIILPDGPEIKGYTFNGWKLDVSTDAAYESGSSYEVTSGKVIFTGSWTANVYKINWNSNGGQETLAPAEAEYRSTIENFPTPHKEGYTFIGWKSNIDGDDTLYKEGILFTMPGHDVTMTAQWEINTYNVTYDGNGTTIGVYKERDSVEYDKEYTIQQASGITPTRFGYKFLGWKVNGEGNLLPAGSSFTMPAKDVTLVAQWESTSSKSYHMNRGVGYTHDGAFRIKGDPNNYQDKITFYVPDDKEYTFE